MIPTSDVWQAACRRGGRIEVKVEGWLGSTKVHDAIPIISGSVTEDASRPGVRRMLNLTTTSEYWDFLWEPTCNLRPFRGFRYADGVSEVVQLGRFVVDMEKHQRVAGGQIELTCPDRWNQVQWARFTTPKVSADTTCVLQALSWARDAFPNPKPPVASNTVTSTKRIINQTFERDRAAAIAELATTAGFEIYFDHEGYLRARDIPTITNPTVWAIATGDTLLDAVRERSRQRVYNVVVVAGEETDTGAPFTPQIVQDVAADSPTRVSLIGERPYFWTSPTVKTAAEARTAGATILARVRNPALTLDVASAINPALEAGDVVDVSFPDATTEQHVIEKIETPLTVEGVQSIVTKSTRPDEDESE